MVMFRAVANVQVYTDLRSFAIFFLVFDIGGGHKDVFS